MGDWGSGPFENDAALDWLADLTAGETLEPARAALSRITDGGDEPLDLWDAWEAVAAAETVAALRGAPGPDLESDLLEWIEAHPLPVGEDLLQLARSAAHHIRTSPPPEIEEGLENDREWPALMDDLITRLE